MTGRWGGGHDGAHASVSTSCFSVTCNAVDRPQNIVKRQCWNASHRNLNTWFLPRKKKQQNFRSKRQTTKLSIICFINVYHRFPQSPSESDFVKNVKCPRYCWKKTYWINGVNCWEILSFEHFQCRKSQQFNLACLDKHGNNFNVFQWPTHTQKKTVTWWELALVPRFRKRKQIEKGQNLERMQLKNSCLDSASLFGHKTFGFCGRVPPCNHDHLCWTCSNKMNVNQ